MVTWVGGPILQWGRPGARTPGTESLPFYLRAVSAYRSYLTSWGLTISSSIKENNRNAYPIKQWYGLNELM